MKITIYFFSVFFFLIVLGACSVNPQKKQVQEFKKNVELDLLPISDTLVKLTDLEPCDILVKPNNNLLPGTSWVNGGRGFGHVVMVIEGGKDTNTMNLLRKVKIFESQARRVPGSYELRLAPGFQEGDDYRFANTTFGLQNQGFRYRLRLNLTRSQQDSIIQFVLAQDNDISNWRSLKQVDRYFKHLDSETIQDKKIWYCSLLIWEAFYQVLGIDLDPNGGIMVFPNDLVASPYFDNDKKHLQKRVRF